MSRHATVCGGGVLMHSLPVELCKAQNTASPNTAAGPSPNPRPLHELATHRARGLVIPTAVAVVHAVTCFARTSWPARAGAARAFSKWTGTRRDGTSPVHLLLFGLSSPSPESSIPKSVKNTHEAQPLISSTVIELFLPFVSWFRPLLYNLPTCRHKN